MRFLTLFLTLIWTAPALAHPTHIEAAGGHSHWFELALGGVALAVAADWIAVRLSRIAASRNG